jgi:ribosomal protein S10
VLDFDDLLCLLDDYRFPDRLPTRILCEGVVHARKKENSQSESHFRRVLYTRAVSLHPIVYQTVNMY